MMGEPMKFGTPTQNPEDTCHCGDWRKDHIDGTGACKLNGLGHGVPGYRCQEFRLFRHADPTKS